MEKTNTRTFNLFKLEDGLQGLKRALSDANVELLGLIKETGSASLEVSYSGQVSQIHLMESTTTDHPLALFGAVFSVIVTYPVDEPWGMLDDVLTLGFLRGGG
ncbi:MAG: hypothetical protein HOH43_16755 [Candidatus Latescibacteria bacterium]|nr:hypothetical protein [Candidatus Latescibacterota bacterium]